MIIRSKDEADRLRLTLTSLACQSEPPEVVVVNDGSSDHTRDVIAKAEGVNIVALHNATPAGRSAASNAGAAAASGDVVLFLDARFSSQPRRGILLSASKSCLPNPDLARFRMTNSNVREMPT